MSKLKKRHEALKQKYKRLKKAYQKLTEMNKTNSESTISKPFHIPQRHEPPNNYVNTITKPFTIPPRHQSKETNYSITSIGDNNVPQLLLPDEDFDSDDEGIFKAKNKVGFVFKR